VSGGLTKNNMSWAWVAERAIVATKMPVSTQQAHANRRSTRLPRNSTWKKRRATVRASPVIRPRILPATLTGKSLAA